MDQFQGVLCCTSCCNNIMGIEGDNHPMAELRAYFIPFCPQRNDLCGHHFSDGLYCQWYSCRKTPRRCLSIRPYSSANIQHLSSQSFSSCTPRPSYANLGLSCPLKHV